VGGFCGSELFTTHNSLYLPLSYTCHPPSRSTSIQTPFANFSQNHAEARLSEGAGSLFDGHAPKQSAARERVKHRIFKCRMWIYDPWSLQSMNPILKILFILSKNFSCFSCVSWAKHSTSKFELQPPSLTNPSVSPCPLWLKTAERLLQLL
jgi:hypothetical protein